MRFDAWAAAFGDTSTETGIAADGTYKPVTRFAAFHQRRRFDDDVPLGGDVCAEGRFAQPDHPARIRGGERQLVTAEASPAFKDYQQHLAQRIGAIESRTGRVQKGDDILLAVITDGRPRRHSGQCGWSGRPATTSR